MKNKYNNDAIIGNQNMRISFSNKGELLRIFYPTPDYKQFIDEMLTGVKINDSAIIYLHDDINNEYNQYYTENTNILNTEIRNTYFNLLIKQTDFVTKLVDGKNVLIKRYIFENNSNISLDINFLAYTKLFSNINNMVGSKVEKNILLQYTHDYTLCLFSKDPMLSYRLHNSKEEMKSGVLSDKDYIGIGDDAAISFDIGHIEPNQSKEFNLYIYINNNTDKYKFDEIIYDVEKIKLLDVKKEEKNIIKYWNKYLKEHDGLRLLSNAKEWREKLNYLNYEDVKKIYIRSILLFPLLLNEKTGGISATMEIDEGQTKCGRYSYCWPRDAVFITKAFDLLNMEDATQKFYNCFCKETQSFNGMWEQRFYTDYHLAPSWGSQIDETASIIYGIYEHYKLSGNKQFLKDTYEMCKKAILALDKTVNELFDENKQIYSYDLWEMNEGEHLYSLSAIYAAYYAMIQIEKLLDENANVDKLIKTKEKLKEYCMKNYTDDQDRTLKRSNKDNICDISLLGTVIPFNMFNINSKEIQNTIERIEMTLRTYTGGYLRFENDSYLNGNNPWSIATLWMAMFNLQKANRKEALKQIDFVTKTTSDNGFIAEQINNETLKSLWAIGLGWAHAMYIISLSLL